MKKIVHKGIDLKDMPGPAPDYVTVAMANSDYRSKRCAWPISGDHTTRSKAARAAIPMSDYIELARRKNVW